MISTLAQIKIYTEQSFQSYLRTKRFIFFLVLVVLIGAITYSLEAARVIQVPTTAGVFDSNFFNYIADVIIIVGAFLGGDALASDFSLKTGTFILSQPSRRSSILLGRYLGALATGVTAISLYYVLGAAGMLYLYAEVPILVGESYLLALVYAASGIAFGFLFSSMFKNGSVAIVITFIVMLLVFGVVNSVLDLANTQAWFLLTYGGSVVTAVLNSPYPSHMHVANAAGISVTVYVPYVWEGLVIMIGYFVISLVISMLIYSRRQI